MKRLTKVMFQAIAICILVSVETACPPPGDDGEVEGEVFMLPGNIPLEMVDIPAGTFMMGSTNGNSNEEPVHQVTLTQSFQLGQLEITQAQWQAIMDTTPWVGRVFARSDPDTPAVYISWDDAEAFIAELNIITGETFRLPTEAEWEYVCRAGTATEYSFGNNASDLHEYAWYNENSFYNPVAHAVGRKLRNAWGLYDMHGNVWEWCQDWYGNDYYSSSPSSDPAGPENSAGFSGRVVRGGAFDGVNRVCRSAYRLYYSPDYGDYGIGFRVARTVPAP